MSYCIRGVDSLLRAVVEHAIEQTVSGVGIPPGKFRLEVRVGLVFEGQVFDEGQLGVAGPDLLRRRTDRVDDQIDQLQLASRREKGGVQQQLSQNTPTRCTLGHFITVQGMVITRDGSGMGLLRDSKSRDENSRIFGFLPKKYQI